MNKKNLTERDICTKYITPALVRANWDVLSQIREEVFFTRGRIIVRGKLVTRGKAKFADYILYYKPNIPIALIEAKDNHHPVGGGMQQGLAYASTLDIPFVFSSNGDARKYYFTLLDFRKATNHFADPDFDGVPVQIYEPGEDDPVSPPDDVPPADDSDDPVPPEPGADETVVVDPTPPVIDIPTAEQARAKYYIHGNVVKILAERIEYLDENGKLVTESLRDYSKKTLRKQFASLEAFLKRGKGTERKQAIIEELAAEGLMLDPLADEVGKDLDPFDLICHVAFDQPPLTRRERADNVRKRDAFTKYGDQARAVLEALLQKYQDEGVTGLDDPRILKIAPFDALCTPVELLKTFGGRDGFEKAVHELQAALYRSAA